MEAAPAQAGLAIGDLPQGLLGRILSLAGSAKEIGPTVTLVSHAWRDALYSEPGFWSRLRMVAPAAQPDRPSEQHTARLAAQLSLGCRVAPLVTALHIRDVDSLQWAALSGPGIGSAERLFGLLRPDRLVDLDLSGWTAMPPSLLSRFPNLHSLSLSSCKCNGQPHWPPAMLHSVCSMRQLKVLAISGSHFPPQLLSAVAEGLPQLYALMVTSRQGLQHADQLTHITGLRYLMLIEYPRVESCLQPPAPAQLPSLQSYYLRAAHAGMQLPGVLASEASWPMAYGHPSGASFQLEGICQLSSLQAALESMAPPAGGSIHSLTLDGQLDVLPAAVALSPLSTAAQRLASLQELRLRLRPADPADSMAVLLQALLPAFENQLTFLMLHGSFGPQLPPTVAHLRKLRHLALLDCALTQLPGGPYMEALEVLNLQGGSFLALPAVLPSSLTKLVPASNAALELSVTDADRLLALPHLAELELRGTATPPAVLARLQQAPNLRITS